jgi:hypothetical protein
MRNEAIGNGVLNIPVASCSTQHLRRPQENWDRFIAHRCLKETGPESAESQNLLYRFPRRNGVGHGFVVSRL